jgi:hypothetical protein
MNKTLKDAAKVEVKYQKEKYKLERQRTKIFLQYAMKGGLREERWNIDFGTNPVDGTVWTKLYTSYMYVPKLVRLSSDYMAATTLSKGVEISIKDGVVELEFDSPARARSFIDKLDLRINFADVKETYTNIVQEKQKIDAFTTAYGVTLE